MNFPMKLVEAEGAIKSPLADRNHMKYSMHEIFLSYEMLPSKGVATVLILHLMVIRCSQELESDVFNPMLPHAQSRL